MENADEEAVPHNPISDLFSKKTLTILSNASLGLGLGFLYTRSPQTVKPISTAIKVSEAALKGTRSLTAIRSPADFLLFSQYLIKISFAAASRFNCAPALDTKKIKAYLGAVNLVRYTRFLPVLGIGVFDLGFLKIGYKLSKNFMKVLEGFLGVQLDSAVRNCVEVVDLFMKTAAVTREVSRIVDSTDLKERLKLREVDRGDCSENWCCTSVKNLDFDCGVCLDVERVEFAGWVRPSFGDCRYSNLGFGVREGDLSRALSSEFCLSDLFCLSIPVPIEIVKHRL
ncbi:hypothetical protein ACLOJK_007830 [Asimina triloba]